METIKTYYQLTKPGIIYGNALNATGGFLLASFGSPNFLLLIQTLVGSSLVVACGCVFNNYLDRGIDAKMDRTKKRALVNGGISVFSALAYGTLLGILGIVTLVRYTNLLTVSIGLLGLFFYVVIYGIAKRTTTLSTVIGSVSGAVPPIAAYTAVTNRYDIVALLLSLVFVAWQMPHFYAISIYRLKEYKAAGLPVLSVKKGINVTKQQIFMYTFAFVVACLLLGYYGKAGFMYFLIVTILGIRWLYRAYQGFSARDADSWARNFFGFSLIVVLGLDIALALAFIKG